MRMLRPRTALAAFSLTLAAALLLPATPAIATTPVVTVTVNRSMPGIDSALAVGATLTQYALNTSGDAAAIASGQALMRQAVRYQVQPTMGQGTGNPEPAPGVYAWASLDARVAQITATGGIPVLNLFGAPDWMKGGLPNQTNWNNIDIAPLASHYGDFAALARQIALRYPTVRNYIVWSENKGFWSKTLNNYDYTAYTNMYNLVYDALKSVNVNNRVGGPYMVLAGTGSMADSTIATAQPIVARDLTFLDYWLKYKHGADFLAVDRKLAQRADTTPYTNDQLMALTPWFQKVTQQLRSLTPLPIWYAESYFRCQSGNENFMAAGLASMLYQELRGGAAMSLRWSPERQPGGGCAYLADYLQNLFTSTRYAGGGQPLAAFYVYRIFNQSFGPGIQLYKTLSSSPWVEALSNATNTLLINKMSTPVDVDLNGTTVPLGAYQVTLV